MKANLDEKGCLCIVAENPVESFALTHWYRLWQEHEATLMVTTVERAEDSPYLDTHYTPVSLPDSAGAGNED